MRSRLTRIVAVAAIGAASLGGVAGAADGDLDTGFDSDGIVTTSFGADDAANDVAVQPDGKIVVVGWTNTAPGNKDFAVARYNADGTLDTSFDGDGKVVTPIGSADDRAVAVAVQPDGKIVVAGDTYNTGPGVLDVAVVRYKSDGSLDTTFDGDGKFVTAYGLGTDVALQPDNKIVVATRPTIGGSPDLGLLRLNPDGSLDASFSGDGRASIAIGTAADFTNRIALYPDGRIAVAGEVVEGANVRVGVARFKADGAPDTTFGTNGATFTRVRDFAYGVDVDLQFDGKLVVAGFSRTTGLPATPTLVRYNVDGTLDTTFDGDGVAFGPSAVTAGGFAAVTVLPDRRIIAIGGGSAPTDRMTAVRFRPDGSLDPTFGTGGLATAQAHPTFSSAYGGTLAPDGSIIAVGQAVASPAGDFAVAKFKGVPSAGLSVIAPTRVLDTRSGTKPAAGSITRVNAGAPAGAFAVLANLTMTRAVGAGFITADRCGALTTGPQTKSNGNYVPNIDVANNTVVNVDADGGFCIYADQPVDLVVDVQGYYTSAGLRLTTVAPNRALDTRSGAPPATSTIVKVVTGAPAGATAVLANLTMTGAAAPGFITADKCSVLTVGAQTKSNGNFVPNIDVANNGVVNVDPDGSFCVFFDKAVHLVVDVQGYYRAGTGRSLTLGQPQRQLDTRQGAKPAARSITTVQTAVPIGTTAVLLNLTVTRANAAGFITADKCSALTPGPQAKSNANYRVGVDVANTSVVNVDPDGSFCIYTDQAADLIADIQGWY